MFSIGDKAVLGNYVGGGDEVLWYRREQVCEMQYSSRMNICCDKTKSSWCWNIVVSDIKTSMFKMIVKDSQGMVDCNVEMWIHSWKVNCLWRL